MKKLRLMSMLVFVPIVLGVLMLILGTTNDNSSVAYAGVLMLEAGIPVTMFILVVVGLVLMITGKLKLDDSTTSSVKKLIKDAMDEKADNADNSTDSDDDDEWEDYDADKDDDFDNAAINNRDSDDESDSDDEAKNDSISAVSSNSSTATAGDDDDDEWEDFGGYKEEKPQSEREKEYAQIEDINSSYGYSSKIKEAEYISRHSANIYKNSSSKQKVLGGLFLGFLLTDFAMIMVFGFLNIWVGAIVCFCLFGGTILLAILITVIMQKISMSGAGKKNGDALDGKVKLCAMSSSSSTGSEHTTRIKSVVYKVTVEVEDREYSAYTKTFYETGDSVKIVPRGKHLATIVEDDEEEDWDDL